MLCGSDKTCLLGCIRHNKTQGATLSSENFERYVGLFIRENEKVCDIGSGFA